MAQARFSGVYTALITPFTDDCGINEQALERLIEHQIAEGIDGLVPCGTTGESPTLSHEEHDRVIELTVEYASGRVPVIAGTGSNATSEAVRLSRHAQDAGADAVLLVNPYYNKPTQKGLFLHFKEIADSVSIPCIVYNIKGRTGVNVENDTMERLARDCKNIVAVKEASGDLAQMRDLINRNIPDFTILSGDDTIALDLIEMGGHGVISVASNLLPGPMKQLMKLAFSGDFPSARALNNQLTPFFEACFLETNPIPIKTAMAKMGWCEEIFRLPMCSFESEEKRETLYAIMAELKAAMPHAF